jgi:hypothetical protein
VLIWRPTCKLVLSSLQQRGGSVPFKPLVSLAGPGIGSHLSTTSCLQHNNLLVTWYIFCLRLWALVPRLHLYDNCSQQDCAAPVFHQVRAALILYIAHLLHISTTHLLSSLPSKSLLSFYIYKKCFRSPTRLLSPCAEIMFIQGLYLEHIFVASLLPDTLAQLLYLRTKRLCN